jgi:uncharacterized damage-inducible protein DinB
MRASAPEAPALPDVPLARVEQCNHFYKENEMRLTTLLCAIFLLGCGTLGYAQDTKPAAKPTVTEVLNAYVSNVEREFVPAAEAMPEDKYSFAPTNGEFKGVRTFAEEMKHVAAVNYLFGAAILQEKPPVDINQEKGPDSLKAKADIVKFLNDSFAYLHQALNSVNQENLVEPIKNPFGEGTTTRFRIALMAVGHPWDHYGQMVEYLRMNSIIPPASRR